jgi:hypothetical protein
VWVVPDRKRDVSSISQGGVFATRIVGVYHVMAVATTDQGQCTKDSSREGVCTRTAGVRKVAESLSFRTSLIGGLG